MTVPIPVVSEGGERKRKRGRKPKFVTEKKLALTLASVEEGGKDEGLVNKNGVVVDLEKLAQMEDPYGPELKRRTEGRVKPEELLGFISELKGQWGSRRKKRKIVDANDFGDALPNGWKVLIGMKKRAGQAWVFCRRYVSPTGRYFASCKEVSSYLLALTSPEESNQQSIVQCTEDSMVEDKVGANVEKVRTAIDGQSLYVASQPNDYENQQRQICTSQTVYQVKEVIMSNNVQPGEVKVASALKCHKCSTPFSEKDGLLNHLISCHKRKRRKSGAPIEDDVLLKYSKYECQFCDRIFHERSSYFGHVGIHVKNYVKSIGGSPSVTPKQKTSDLVSIGGAPVALSGMPVSAEFNAESVAGTPNVLAGSEPNLNDSKLMVGSDGETNSDNCNNDQNNLPLHSELNIGATSNDKAPMDESSEKPDRLFCLSDNKVGEVDKPAGISAVKPDPLAGDGKVLYNDENNDFCQNSGEINANECTGPVISSSPAVPRGDAGYVPAESGQLDQGNVAKLVAGCTLEDKDPVSENGLPATDKIDPSSNKDLVDRSMDNKNVEHNCRDEGLKAGNNDELMVEPRGGHLDIVVNVANGIRNTGNLEECLGVPLEEEKVSGVSVDNIGYRESILADLEVERNSETSSRSGVQCTIGVQNYDKDIFNGLVNGAEADLCSLGKDEVTVDAKHYIDEETQTETVVPVGPVPKNKDCNYIRDDAEEAPAGTVMEPKGAAVSQAEQAFSPKSTTREPSSRIGEEPAHDAVANSNTLFFTSDSTGTPLDANVMANNGQERISEACSRIASGSGETHSDLSDVLGAYNSFVDSKEEQDSKNLLSGLSINEHMHEVTIDNVTNTSDGTTSMELPEVTKDENLRDNKLILDFGSMTDEINARFSNSIEQQTVPEGSSPFSLWGEQICLEDSQTRAYGGARGLEQGRASDNNSLNLVDLQQSSEGGYNLNKVCMNEQGYAVQHNENGFYNRSNERGERISHGDALNSAGPPRQCDVGYNLNKPCLNQSSFGFQHNQAGAYSTRDEAQQERAAYGNSLTLASVQQTCDTGYNLNKAYTQQTCGAGYSVNKGYLGPVQGLCKLDGLERSRDSDLMIGFGNSASRPNQGVATEFLWRTTEGNIQPGGLVDSSSTRGQSSGSFQAFDFLSDKGGNGLYTGNEKFDISSFEGLRSTSVEPMEFSFLATQDSNAQLEDPKVLSYHGEMDQGFSSAAWNQKGNSLPNMMGADVVSTMCVWCGNEFHQDSFGCEIQAGSIGYLCPTCKARVF